MDTVPAECGRLEVRSVHPDHARRCLRRPRRRRHEGLPRPRDQPLRRRRFRPSPAPARPPLHPRRGDRHSGRPAPGGRAEGVSRRSRAPRSSASRRRSGCCACTRVTCGSGSRSPASRPTAASRTWASTRSRRPAGRSSRWPSCAARSRASDRRTRSTFPRSPTSPSTSRAWTAAGPPTWCPLTASSTSASGCCLGCRWTRWSSGCGRRWTERCRRCRSS